MELNEVQQIFFEKLKLVMMSNGPEASMKKAKEIFEMTIGAAQTISERNYLLDSLTPILDEFNRVQSIEAESTPKKSDIGQDAEGIVNADGTVDVNTNLAGYVNVRNEKGQIVQEKLDLDDDLDVISNAVGASMKNFTKEFHEDEMDPDIAEYLRTHGRG